MAVIIGKVGSEILVNTATAGNQSDPVVTSLSTGGFVVSWYDQSSGNFDIKAQVFGAGGSKLSGEILVNTATTGNQSNPVITSLSTGGFVVSWSDQSSNGGDVKAQVFGANGSKLDGEILVNTATAGNQSNPLIMSLSTGGFVVSWYDQSSGNFDIKAQVFGADGSKLGGEILVNTATTGNQDHPVITSLSTGGFVVSWCDHNSTSGDIKAQVFGADGSKLGGEILVNTATASAQANPVITSLSTGGFVVSWHDQGSTSGDIKAQVFGADGSKLGGEILVNTATAGTQSNPVITSLSTGGFVVSWHDQGSTSGDIKAQLFDANGGTVNGEILVNTATTANQSNAMITSLPTGGFVVSWVDWASNDWDIKAQVFGADGSKLGGEILVNTATAGAQYSPVITSLSTGGFVVSWYDSTSTSGDIKAQVFLLDNLPAFTGGSSVAVSLAENTVAVTTVSATDADGTPIVYSIGGGADAALFTINASTGALSFVNAPDYETPTDAGANNVYDVIVTATSGGESVDQAIAITVTDVSEGGGGGGSSGGSVINGTSGADHLVGTSGDDTIISGDGADTIFGGDGKDVIVAGNGGNVIVGGEDSTDGADSISSGTGDDIIYGNGGDDTIVSNGGNDTVAGGHGADLIELGDGNDLVYGNQGNDTIDAGGGANTVYGGAGDDRIVAGDASDLLFGNDGQDTIDGGNGDNTIVGGQNSTDGADLLTAGSGNDLIYGNGGDDTISGGSGNNSLIGGHGSDSVTSGDGNDIIYGNHGDDTIDAGNGANLIFAGQGNDIVVTGSGDDTIWGNMGDDTLTGGGGADLYVFGDNSGRDIIHGFSFAEGDRLDLQGQSFTQGTAGDGSIVLTLSGGGTITLAGVTTFQAGFVV